MLSDSAFVNEEEADFVLKGAAALQLQSQLHKLFPSFKRESSLKKE